jgi:hypothetical protein
MALSLQMRPVRFNRNKDHMQHVSQSAADDTLSKPLRNDTRPLKGGALQIPGRVPGRGNIPGRLLRSACLHLPDTHVQDDSPWGLETKNG